MRLIYTLAALAIAVVGVAVMMLTPKEAPVNTPAGPTVVLAGSTFAVELARTPAEQELGLGGRDSLAAGHGMLFIFPQAGNWGFWMKDTRMPLDIIWARADGTVISIARNVATSTYSEVPPKVFYPTTPDALYVLEVAADAAAGAKPGDKMTINI